VEFVAYDAAGDVVFSSWDYTAPFAVEDMEVPAAGTYRIVAEARDAEYLTATASIHVVASDPPDPPAVQGAGGRTLTDVRG
jgi:hypothetical protein